MSSNANPGTSAPASRQVPHGWPAEVEYRPWRMRLVQVVVVIGVLTFGFGSGALVTWLNRPTGSPSDQTATQPAGKTGDEVKYWTCSMHPHIQLPSFGQCPICFMDLIPVRVGEGGDSDLPIAALSERARELVRVETAPVERRPLTHDIRMVGKVVADETLITYISTYIPGRLDRLFVNYTGILVRKGDHLAEIYSPDLLVAQREYLVALDAIAAASQPADRPGESATAKALAESARRKLELWGVPKDEIEHLEQHRQPGDHMRIDAPAQGWVLERMGYEGMYVETGTRIFTIADLRSVWVLLDAYELDVGLMRVGQEVQFEAEAQPGTSFSGRVSYIDPVLGPSTRTIKVRVNVANPELKLKPQMFVRARLQVPLGEDGVVLNDALAGKWVCYMHPEVVKDGPGKCDVCEMDLVTAESLDYVSTGDPTAQALAVPRSAVLWTGARAVVYVETEADQRKMYEGREVTLGPRAAEYYVVKQGLQEGERVAVHGALMIDSAMQIQAKPSMMKPATSRPAESAAGTEDAHEHAVEAEIPSRYVAGAMYHDHAAPVITAYLGLADALAADDTEAAVRATAALRKGIESAVPHGLEGEAVEAFKLQMRELAATLPSAEKPSIDDLRNALPKLTKALDAYLRGFGHKQAAPVVEVFCPMAFDDKGANWLQVDETVRNPYFGKKMLRCGEIKGRIGSDGRRQDGGE